jgi:hypothetical protein
VFRTGLREKWQAEPFDALFMARKFLDRIEEKLDGSKNLAMGAVF